MTARAKLLALFRQWAWQEGDFVLSSGRRSTYYINGKRVALHPYGAWYAGQVLQAMLPPDTAAVGGLTLGADPLVTAVAIASAQAQQPVMALIVRKEAKGHGTGAWIEGPLPAPGSRVAVLEDVVTTGKSALLAAERLRAAGFVVDTVLTLVDREEGGPAALAAAGLQMQAVFTLTELQRGTL